MIKEIDEIAKEIDTFRENLLGVNGIVEHIRIANKEIRKSADISNEQIARLTENLDEINSLRDSIINEINTNFVNVQTKFNLALSSNNENVKEIAKLRSEYIDGMNHIMNSIKENLELMVTSRFENLSADMKNLLSEIEKLHIRMINTIISYQDRQIQFNANVFQKVLDLQKANELFFDKMSDKLNKMKSRNNLLIVISIFILAVSIVSLFI
ncbi:MAG: hypothetical protein PHY13_05810 [Clostridia bacterium]|jgi:hypothetical protein|nr:hypothetical protein [Clostridia bacterium]